MQKSLANQIKGVCQALLQEIVPRTGVEPVISALKGRRPWPLDERGVQITGRIVRYCWCFVKQKSEVQYKWQLVVYCKKGYGDDEDEFPDLILIFPELPRS